MPLAHLQTCTHQAINIYPAEISTDQTKNSQNLSSENEATEQIGSIKLSLKEICKDENQQTIVFLTEPLASQSQETVKLTSHTSSELLIDGLTDTAINYHQQQFLDVDLFPEEQLFWSSTIFPVPEIRQGELNTPTIGKSYHLTDDFSFAVYFISLVSLLANFSILMNFFKFFPLKQNLFSMRNVFHQS